MKKTIIALMALTGVAMGATLTEIADMDALVGSMSSKDAATTDGYNQTVYTLSDGAYYGSTNNEVINALTGTSGVVTFAAWVQLPDVSGYETLVGWGANGTGFKFGVKDDDLFYVTKNIKETVINTSISANQWTLIALQFNTADKKVRLSLGTTDGGYYSITDNANMNAVTVNQFSIGSPDGNGVAANTQAGNENFGGMISGFKVFTSTDYVDNSALATAIGAAPVSVPEPTTATLSLLALAGLAARRRRK